MNLHLYLQAAETTDFMILGLGVIMGVIAVFVAYLVIRKRNLERDLELLESIEAEE